MENQIDYNNAADEEFQEIVNEQEKLGNQMTILMDLLKIPKEERNFEELKKWLKQMPTWLPTRMIRVCRIAKSVN